MQKFIRISAIVATALVAVSMLLLLVTLPFQGLIARGIETPDEIIGVLPKFPTVSFVRCFLLLGCTALLTICAGNKRGGLWLEVLIFIAIAVIVPLVSGVLSYAHTILIGHFVGSVELAAHGTVSTIANLLMCFCNLGQMIALVTCGMSISFKRMSKEWDPFASH